VFNLDVLDTSPFLKFDRTLKFRDTRWYQRLGHAKMPIKSVEVFVSVRPG